MKRQIIVLSLLVAGFSTQAANGGNGGNGSASLLVAPVPVDSPVALIGAAIALAVVALRLIKDKK